MKFTSKTVTAPKEILANDHYVAITVDFNDVADLAVEGIIKAGTIAPQNDASAIGVVLYDVNINENPNGALVVHGFIDKAKLPTQPTEEAEAALVQVKFI